MALKWQKPPTVAVRAPSTTAQQPSAEYAKKYIYLRIAQQLEFPVIHNKPVDNSGNYLWITQQVHFQ